MPSGPRYWGARTWTWRTGSKPNSAGIRSVAIVITSSASAVGARAVVEEEVADLLDLPSVGLAARRLAASGSSGRRRRSSSAAPGGRRARAARSARSPTRSARRTACRDRPAAAGRRRRSARGGSPGRSPAIRCRQISSESIDASSTITRSASIGESSSRPGISPGIHSSALWIVEAGAPSVAWVSRRAARPVGASSRIFSSRDSAIRASAWVRWVLPVPGPPVITDSRRVSAFVDRLALLVGQVARSRPRAGGLLHAGSERAIPASVAASQRSARKVQLAVDEAVLDRQMLGRALDVDASDGSVPSSSRIAAISSAQRQVGVAARSRPRAARGRAAARIRDGESRSTPLARASRSALWKPIPAIRVSE